MTTPLVGYQARVDWLGEEILTLADVWPEHPRAMIVGLNPAPASVEAGHYYQGRAGQRQLMRLVEAGVIDPPDGSRFEATALRAGIGFTDLVKRPTRSERDVTAVSELAYGTRELEAALASHGVPLVICVFRHPVEALLRRAGAAGVQPTRTSWGAQVFRMPGPFAAKADADAAMAQLLPLIARQARR